MTRAPNTGMVAAMRGLGLPLDYQIEEGTLVITARLDAHGGPTRSSAAESSGAVNSPLPYAVQPSPVDPDGH